jgi:hypothetical protein
MANLGFIAFNNNNPLVAAVSCGAQNSCVIYVDGKIFCWGRGFSGVNGQGTVANIGDAPERPLAMLNPIVFGTEDPAVLLSVGSNHAYHIISLYKYI